MGFGTAVHENVVDAQASFAALRHFWPRLRTPRAPEVATRYTVEPLENVIRNRSLGDAMRSYAEHAPRLAQLASSRALADAQLEPRDLDMVISVSCTRYLRPAPGVRRAAEMGMRADI